MHLVLTGNLSKEAVLRRHPDAQFHSVLTRACTLLAGRQCQDGRPITESARYKEAVRRGLPIQFWDKEEPPKEAGTLWVDRHAPRSLSDVIGHKESISQLRTWLQSWSKGAGALVIGPPGIGKTTSVHLLAKEQGYTVVEYNASDTRSMSKLKGLLALGMRRLHREATPTGFRLTCPVKGELWVMDEIDGFTAQDRGGVGELADMIRKAPLPIVCIGNEMSPKLAPLQRACTLIKFSRPVKSTIAAALLGVCKKEGLMVSKAELESMCEKSGNDIRSLINALQFYQPAEATGSQGEKDSMLRLDLFSATQKLMSNKRTTLQEADDLVYVDYGMVPLMVQEAYLAASRTLDEAVAASEQVSWGDLVSRQQWSSQDWSLLPHVVHSTVATSRKVTGPCPFQIFPRLLGQNSKRGKHQRGMDDVARARGLSRTAVRLDEAAALHRILLSPLSVLKGEKTDKPVIQGVMARMKEVGVSRDHLVEQIGNCLWNPMEIPSKVKAAWTREYNKANPVSTLQADSEEEEEEEPL